MSICVYPGSFDPVTLGHVDVISRAAAVFDCVIVAVLTNVNKRAAFSRDIRAQWVERAVCELCNVQVVAYSGLLMDFMRIHEADVLVRGLRGTQDFDTESTAAWFYDSLQPRIETVLFATKPALAYVNSSYVRELLSFGGSIDALVPDIVKSDILQTYDISRTDVRGNKE